MTANTVLHYHANIRKALRDAIRLELIDRNVADIVERPKKEKFIPDYYSADEANQLLEKFKGRGYWLRIPVTLALFYGLRRSEVLGLQWKSVDFEAGTLLIQHIRLYQEVEGKSVAVGQDRIKQKSSYRTLPLVNGIKNLLRRERQKRYGEMQPSSEDYVCLSRKGKPIAPGYFSQSFKQFLRENGLREICLRFFADPESNSADRSTAVAGPQFGGNHGRHIRTFGIRDKTSRNGSTQKI